ncbi:MAG: SH3 domain-containing protein [Clostridium sp.]|nr:SH3 domain-containing protein [Clostridium sp.]
MKFTLDESGYFNVAANKKENDLKEHGQVVNVDSNLCIRNDSDIKSEVIYMLYEGMTFEIIDKDSEWYNIKYNDITGYVNEQYVEEYDDDPPYETYEEREKNTNYESADDTHFEPIDVELTAYCNCTVCSENWGSETAMQTQTRRGVVAAPKEITLGSRLYIPDLKYYKEDMIFDVEDRGGAVKVKDDGTYIIDVWLPNHEEVKEFGRKKSVVYLIKN